MIVSRIFQNTPLEINSIIELNQPASYHLARVLRAQVGDKVVIFNGQGGEYESTIAQITKKNVRVRIEKFDPRNVESTLMLHLVQGISRGEKMDYTIQKAVQLGVTKITPVFTERCTVKLDEERSFKRWEHWNSIIINACEQCGRTLVPELCQPILFTDWLQEKKANDFAFVLVPGAKTALKKIPIESSSRIVLFIGPEGGLSPAEIQLVGQNGFISLGLGPRILRTETAAVAVLAVFQALFGDLVI